MCIWYCAIDFWTSSAYPCCVGCRIWLHCACCALCWSCTPITAKGWSYRQIWWCSWIRTTIGDLFGGSLVCARPLGSGGIFSQLAALFAAQRDLKKKCVSHAQNVNGIWLQRQERRQILRKRSTTHHTLLLFGMPQAGTRALSRDLAPSRFFNECQLPINIIKQILSFPTACL